MSSSQTFRQEYNSNFPWDAGPLAFPDLATMSMPAGAPRGWDRGCFYGSSANAIALAAREAGYSLVDVEPTLDLFLVRSDLWGSRATLAPSAGNDVAYRPFHVRRDKPFDERNRSAGAIHGAWTKAKEGAYLDCKCSHPPQRKAHTAYPRSVALIASCPARSDLPLLVSLPITLRRRSLPDGEAKVKGSCCGSGGCPPCRSTSFCPPQGEGRAMLCGVAVLT